MGEEEGERELKKRWRMRELWERWRVTKNFERGRGVREQGDRWSVREN